MTTNIEVQFAAAIAAWNREKCHDLLSRSDIDYLVKRIIALLEEHAEESYDIEFEVEEERS